MSDDVRPPDDPAAEALLGHLRRQMAEHAERYGKPETPVEWFLREAHKVDVEAGLVEAEPY